MAAILGKKISMTSVFDDTGKSIPCTVIEAGPCFISQVKTVEKDGVSSYQISYGEKKKSRSTKSEKGHFSKAGVSPGIAVADFSTQVVGKGLALGSQISVDVFNPDDKVDVVGISKGKGFAGVVKRHGFSGGVRSHGQSDRLRAPGSVGGSSSPSKTFKGQKMAGRMGGDTVVVQNMSVVKVISDLNMIIVKGGVPGNKKGYVKVVSSKKARHNKA